MDKLHLHDKSDCYIYDHIDDMLAQIRRSILVQNEHRQCKAFALIHAYDVILNNGHGFVKRDRDSTKISGSEDHAAEGSIPYQYDRTGSATFTSFNVFY